MNRKVDQLKTRGHLRAGSAAGPSDQRDAGRPQAERVLHPSSTSRASLLCVLPRLTWDGREAIAHANSLERR
jgi:hypothetical protein